MGSGDKAPRFLSTTLDGREWSASSPSRFASEERSPGTHWIGGWVGTRAGLDYIWKYSDFMHLTDKNNSDTNISSLFLFF
jgi:hypothetical protein